MANVSTLGAALDQISRLKVQQGQVDLLTMQIATGKKTQSFEGLGVEVLLSKRARADVGALDTYINNIKNTDRRIKLMMNGIEDIQEQARTILNSFVTAVQEGDFPDFQTMKDLTGNVSKFIIDTINLQDGDRYLYAGADSANKPVTDTGLFESFLGEFVPDESDLTNPPLVASGVIGQWGDGSITTSQFIASYRGVNETLLGYSPNMVDNQSGSVFVRVDDKSEFNYTVLADSPGIKEILTALKVFENLPPPEYAPGALNDPAATTFANDTPPFPPREKQDNFYQVLNDLTQYLGAAIDKLDGEQFRLSQVQAQITRVKVSHEEDINSLKSVISSVEDVDLTEAATKINQLQISLEASFRVTALVSQLTLANFL
ncbi:MAG: hypothetical protein J0L77_00980 [Alphaproteobacteria bacterium]|nr:hypothetical protein [Alphaproteobacteria bacterium]